MSITFSCPECGVALRVDDESAGRMIRCGRCMTAVRVPGTAVPPPPPPPAAPRWPEPDAASSPEPEPPLSLDREPLPVDEVDEPETPPRPRRRRRRPPPPKGRGPLFWLLVVGGILAALCFACCGGVYLLLPGPQWQTHESTQGGFKVDLPAAPRKDLAKLSGVAPEPGMQVEGTVLWSRMEEYAVIHGDIPRPGQRAATDEAMLDASVKSLKSESDVRRVVRETQLTVSGFPAREIEIELKNGGSLLSRVVVAETKVYVVIAGGRFSRPGNERVRRFVDSFEITDRAQLARLEERRRTRRRNGHARRPSGSSARKQS